MKRWLIVCAVTTGALAALVPGVASGAVTVTGLQTDGAQTPLGIDDAHPRLSWRLDADRRAVRQSAYEVVVRDGGRVVWDSGRMTGSDPWADYGGAALASRRRYDWTVRVWDQRGTATTYAPPSWFETAFMSPSEWSAQWIQGPAFSPPPQCSQPGAPVRECTAPSPLLRTEFDVGKPVARARLYASGMGYGTYFLNGRRVGDAVLEPGFTDYTKRVFYVTADVTGLLRSGRNALGAELGRGPYGQVEPNYAGYQSAPWHAEPALRLELHVTYRDGSTAVVRSSPSWKTTDGPIRFDDYMLGETYDARRAAALDGWSTAGFDDGKWGPARPAAGPKGTLTAEVEPPVRPEHDTIAFKSVKELSPGDYLFDLGENVAGNAILDAGLHDGQTLSLHYGEKLDSNGHVDTSGGSSGDNNPFQLDEYTATAGRNVWRPEFTYKGFQYVEVTGLQSKPDPSMLRAQVWHADVPQIGHWESSNPLLDRIVAASRRSILANTFSQPTDTPVYEKTGYTGDGQLVAGADSYLFDMRRFYTKWIEDIRETVAPNGDMPIIAPSPGEPPDPDVGPLGFHGPSPGWDAALFVVPDLVRLFGGDERPEARVVPQMKMAMAYYDSQAPSGLLLGTCVVPVLSQPCYNGLGDWSAPTNSTSGVSVDSNAWWAEMLRIEGEAATLTGDTAAASAARARRDALVAAFNQAFADPGGAGYRDPTTPPSASAQHEDAVALGLDMVPADRRPAVGEALAADVRGHGEHLTTGIMGTRFLWDALASTGHLGDAWAALTQETYPSYGYWLDQLGWTGLGENWEASTRSRNHQMFGSVVQWMFGSLAGYRPLTAGFGDIEFRPLIPPSGVDKVAASTDTVRGTVAASWQRSRSGFALDVTVPPTSVGRVYMPARDPSEVAEVGQKRALPAQTAPGVRLVGQDGDRVVYRVDSGTYKFRVGRAIPAASSVRRCASRRRFRVHVVLRRSERARSVLVRIGGRRIRGVRVRGRRITAGVDLRGRPRKRVVVRIVVRTTQGRRRTFRRVYHPCRPASA